MLEGLAVWALFIYLLRLVGMPWNKGTKSFAYLGGTGWLMFVWVGLINYAPMDLSGGSVVQSPHIQLRPNMPNITGKVEHIYVKPNQKIKEGQLIYDIESTPYKIALEQAKAAFDNAQISISTAKQEVSITQSHYQSMLHDIATSHSEITSAKADYQLQQKMLSRYQKQNSVAKNSITESEIDKQISLVKIAKQKVSTLEFQLAKKTVDADKAKLQITQAELTVASRQADLNDKKQNIEKAKWDLASTQVKAPADGFVTNFILREGQLVSRISRLQMYTEEKYVLMRVNHQAIRNIKVGQAAEFSSSVYPGKVFAAEVEGIIEATGEAQSNLLGLDQSIRATTGKNVQNKHHFVRLKIIETEEYNLPVGAVGLAWISGEKPMAFLGFLDAIRGIIIRMKSQLYFFHSI
ncbi:MULTISPECIES: HlyD family secretion protein [Vibrio]|uniref:HlyD family secretion protein n=1 Tax=Vibrio TaxID=662 RepID=UPI000B5C5F79|nr:MULTISPECIES: efflux RND transporter periplasmic adaptor subunit [Vibrio]HBV75373.1 HlyD family secretion protein [Vibrio sp.]